MSCGIFPVNRRIDPTDAGNDDWSSPMKNLYGKAPLAGLVLFLLPCALWAAPLASLVSPDVASGLLAGSEYRRSATGKTAGTAWTPGHALAARVTGELASEKPNVVVEALYLWKKPASASPEAETLAVYNILRSVASLQGIEYWSASRGKMRLFYEESWRVVSPTDTARIPDQALTELPQRESITVWQKDLSFGGNLNQVDYTSAADGVLMESVNLTKMYYSVVPVASPGALKVRVLVLSVDEGLLFWVVSSANATVVPGVRGKLESSFGNRAEAIFRWFAGKAEEAWKRL